MSLFANRVISIHQHKTSVRLSPPEWRAFETICVKENIPRKILLELIELNKSEKLNLTSSIRLFTINYYKNFLTNPQKTTYIEEKDLLVSPVLEAIKAII